MEEFRISRFIQKLVRIISAKGASATAEGTLFLLQIYCEAFCFIFCSNWSLKCVHRREYSADLQILMYKINLESLGQNILQ